MINTIKLTLTIALLLLCAFANFAQEKEAKLCSVVLEVEFLKTAKIGKVSFFSSDCDRSLKLEQKAIEAVKKVKFKPKVANGEPVTVVKNVRYDFSIVESNKKSNVKHFHRNRLD